MEIRIRDTGALVTETEFRAMHPDTSFPYQLTAEMLNDFGADPVLEGPQPTATKYQVVYRDGVYQDGANWFTKYSVADMGEEAIAAVDAATEDSNRTIRNQKLMDCDWTQLGDVALTPACKNNFIAYREQLRAVDLMNPTWPDEPQEEWA